MGEVETFVERIAYTAEKAVAQQGLYRIFVLFPERFVTPLVIAVVGVVIDSYIGTETGLRVSPGRAVRMLMMPFRADEP